MAAGDARGGAGHVGQHGVEQGAIITRSPLPCVGSVQLGAQTEAIEVVAHLLQAGGVDVDGGQLAVCPFEQVAAFAAGRGTGIEYAFAILHIEPGGGLLCAPILHGYGAFGKQRQGGYGHGRG